MTTVPEYDTVPAQTPTPRRVIVVADDGAPASASAAAWAHDVATNRRSAVLRMPLDLHDPATCAQRLPAATELVVVPGPHGLLHKRIHDRAVTTLLVHADVVVVPQGHQARPGAPVLVVVHGSSAAELHAIEAAFSAASQAEAPLVAVHCWSEPGALDLPAASWLPIDFADYREREAELVAESLAGFQESFPDVSVQRVIRSGRAGSALLPMARDAQIVVVGGGHQTMGLPKGTYSALLRDAGVPVLIVSDRAG